MHRSHLALDEEIAEVEGRLAQRRAELRTLVAEARSRVSVKSGAPVALAAALAVGFAASRFVRKPAPIRAAVRSGSRTMRVAGVLASVLLPRLIGPLQAVATQWLQQRMHRQRPH